MQVLIYGAGSTGCYLGAQLSISGFAVSLLLRKRVENELRKASGITLSNYLGKTHKAVAFNTLTQLNASEQNFDLCLVTLKCHHLNEPQVVRDLIKLSQEGCLLIFMQNGLGSLENLKDKLQRGTCFSGITSYNVVSLGEGKFHQGTEGAAQLPRHEKTEAIESALLKHNFAVELNGDMQAIINGKLLLNLNNALNALSGLPLKQQLETRKWRRVLAAAMVEWLNICKAQTQSLKISAPIKPKWLPSMLRLPTPIFKIVANKMLTIDPQARSSMWEDIQNGRKTEIEFLNAEVARLGQKFSIATPVNLAISEQLQSLEAGEEPNNKTLFRLI